MVIEPSVLSSLLISAVALLSWLATQATTRSKTQRRELRMLRMENMARRRYIYRLESTLADRDLPLPDKPDGYPSEDDDE